jgi:hypothetical protein
MTWISKLSKRWRKETSQRERKPPGPPQPMFNENFLLTPLLLSTNLHILSHLAPHCFIHISRLPLCLISQTFPLSNSYLVRDSCSFILKFLLANAFCGSSFLIDASIGMLCSQHSLLHPSFIQRIRHPCAVGDGGTGKTTFVKVRISRSLCCAMVC